MSGYGLDIIFLLVSFAITLGSQAYIKATYAKTGKIANRGNYNGRDTARRILDGAGLQNVKVVEVSGALTDHYDPRSKVVRLSSAVFNEASVASVSVAAHECGHAIQDKDGYIFLRIRSAIVPVVNLASSLGYIAIMIGMFLGAFGFIRIGIICELVILAFQLITLPVEFNASRRGLKQIEEHNFLDKSETPLSRKMLIAAALTYVASVATAVLQILRLLFIARRRNR